MTHSAVVGVENDAFVDLLIYFGRLLDDADSTNFTFSELVVFAMKEI